MGTNGDMDAQKWKDEIKKYLKACGWPQAEAARKLYAHECDEADECGDDGEAKYVEKFKKIMQRNSTSANLLEQYYRRLKKIHLLECDKYRPIKAVDLGVLSEDMRSFLREVSSEIDDLLPDE